ncbi:hypothetical protein [Rhizobium rhizogenes]|uniref:Uncharacterized protein n=1 Tax=Rhizobium rhizogenes TaxID=359 RepID=A0AA92C4N9_RHIRH|nr:hypothetical protein [Rhizobium rhizogenes]PVE55377.1 hypothetical protein DC430_09295 [Rhizobium rhizogenes]PVE65701.1 hypothetical protein DC415_12195 [Agrobacterium tumefaciens]PVE75765.1 hypothetical protein DCP16_12195 [Sphingomonas sp. TPD3009]
MTLSFATDVGAGPRCSLYFKALEWFSVERISFTYEEIVKSKKSKYDIALKSFMLSQESELRKMLELPDGNAYAAEMEGFDGRSVDTVVDGPAVYHGEFQTKDIDEMPWRMLEYYWLLFRKFSLTSKWSERSFKRLFMSEAMTSRRRWSLH